MFTNLKINKLTKFYSIIYLEFRMKKVFLNRVQPLLIKIYICKLILYNKEKLSNLEKKIKIKYQL
jgi:hypothetical protein